MTGPRDGKFIAAQPLGGADEAIGNARGVCGPRPIESWRAYAREHELRHCLAVVATDSVDAVRYAGGLIFDRMSAGWEVYVVTGSHSDTRPLEILGAHVLDMDTALATPLHARWPESVLISPDMLSYNTWVRQGILACLDRGLSEFAIWGDSLPEEVDRRVATVYHRVSVAARAFKRCALAAAGVQEQPSEDLEVFHGGELLLSDLRGGQHLVRAV